MPGNSENSGWLKPWQPVIDEGESIVQELKRELPDGHRLLGRDVIAVARRVDCDDVLFRAADGSYAVVHLTWEGKSSSHPAFPFTTTFSTFEEFARGVMIPDAEEYGA